MNCCKLAYFLFALILLIHSCQSSTSEVLRGAHPDAAAVYKTAIGTGRFTCADGSRTIPATAINDNYCDCVDGSDEPGSSACSGGSFYCSNRGHKARILSSTFVDDGICDCCDGSDEAVGLCASTCARDGAAAREELKAAAKTAASGYKVRLQRVAAAKAERLQMKSTLQSLKVQIATKQPQVDALTARKEAAEKVATRLREQHAAAQKATEQTSSKNTTSQPAASSATAEPPIVEADTGEETSAAGRFSEAGTLQASEPPADAIETAVASEGGPTDTESDIQTEAVVQPQSAIKTAEERAKETMAQWVKTDAQPASEEAPTLGAEQPLNEAGSGSGDEESESMQQTDDVDNDEGDGVEMAVSSPGAVPALFWRTFRWTLALLGKTPRSVSSSQLDLSERDSSEATREHKLHNDQLQELIRKEKELEAKATLEYGPDDAFLPLHGNCYQIQVDKYVYEACPFGSAQQKEGGSTTSLGAFSKFEDNFTSMVFENGQSCWQGPSRSLKLSLTCGTSEVLSAVSEPSRCMYTARLTTPTLCTSDLSQSLQGEVQASMVDFGNLMPHDEL